MTDKQRIFADEYLKDHNGTRAYKAAYPHIKSDSAAAAAATRLLRNVKVSEYLAEQEKRLHEARIADAQEVEDNLSSVVRGQSQATICVMQGNGNGFTEPKLVQKPPDEKERLKAAELLCRRYGLFAPKEQSTNNGVTITGEDDLEE